MLKNMEAIRQGHMNSFLQGDGNPFSEIEDYTSEEEVINKYIEPSCTHSVNPCAGMSAYDSTQRFRYLLRLLMSLP